jgi:ribosomal protein S18 acetylase RimI-like enzyme
MKVTIELAKEKDLKDIQHLNHLLFIKEHKEYDSSFNLDWTFSDTWTNYFKNHIIEKDYCIFLAKDSNKIIWYLAWWICQVPSYRTIKSQAELENMIILESYRNQWVWSGLMNKFLEWARSKWVQKVTVTASAENSEWINFYRKAWFREYDVRLEISL